MKRPLLLLLALFVVFAGCGDESSESPASAPTTGGDPSTSRPVTTAGPQLGERPTGVDVKIESNLYQAVVLAAEGASVAEIESRQGALRFRNGEVLIELTVARMSPAVVAAAEGAGLTISGEYPDLLLITGSAPISSLRDLAALEEVEAITPQFGATTG